MFRWECPLRWSDMDAQGHVNNAVLVDYLQEARVVFLRRGSASALLDEGIIVTRHQVEYRRPVEYDDGDVVIELGVSTLGASRVELAYEISQGGDVALTMVRGKILYQNGHFPTINLQEVVEELTSYAIPKLFEESK